MSAVPFQRIPDNLRVPLFFAEVDASQANTRQQNQRTLLIGQITAAGAAVPEMPLLSLGPDDAIAQGGAGSMLAAMVRTYRASDPFGEVWTLPLADATNATAATGTLTLSHTPTVAGTLSVYVAGQRLAVPVTLTDTPTTIAAAVAAMADVANPTLPVTAAASAGVVTFTARHAGAAGNDIDLRVNVGGTAVGEATPAGLDVAIAAMRGGATNPPLEAALANLGDMPFDVIVCPYTDTASLDALKALLDDTTGRWSWQTQVYGHVFAALRATIGGLSTFGSTRNNPHETVLGFHDSPSPNWVWAADVAGAAAVALRADPGRPLQTLALHTVRPPPVASRFTLTERNTLLWDGIATFTVARDGTVAIENLITTYQTNAFGQPDDSYLQVETLFLLMLVLRDLAGVVTTKFARMKLADDGTRVAPGLPIVTPSIIRAELIAAYRSLEDAGHVQNSDAFAAALIVQRHATNRNRVDVLWPGTLIDQLRVFALLAQFRR